MSEKLKTSDGYFTVERLLDGEIDQLAWFSGTLMHRVTLRCVRATPDPPLFRVDHEVTDTTTTPLSVAAASEVFDDVRKARNKMRGIRRNPPNPPR